MEWIKFKICSFFLFVTISFSLLSAQKYRVYYDMRYKQDSSSSEYQNKKMILDVNNNETRFYSYKLYRSDSTVISNDKLGKPVTSMSMDYEFMVLKKDEQLSKMYRIFYDIYELSEDKPDFKWKILPETKKINKLTCQLATLDYKGRKWEAWFTSELPYSEGPYVFNGLPGLIVSMYDNEKNYIFNMLGLTTDYEDIYNGGRSFKSIKVNKNQLDKVYMDYYNDPYKEAKAGKIKINFENEKGEKIQPNWNELTKYKQEEIRLSNNPIELSEAVKYAK